MKSKPSGKKMKGTVRTMIVFLFIVSVVAFLVGKTEPLGYFKEFGIRNETSSGTVVSIESSFFSNVRTLLALSFVGGALAAVILRDATLGIISGFVVFLGGFMLSLPMQIFNDFEIPFGIRILIIFPIIIMVAFGLVELLTGRRT